LKFDQSEERTFISGLQNFASIGPNPIQFQILSQTLVRHGAA